MKTIKKTITIRAPKETVWNTMLEDKTYRIWTTLFDEGSYAETDWQLGSKAIFTNGNGSGIIGKITEHKLYEKIVIEYTGLYANSQEDYTCDEAKSIQGSHESYEFSEKDGYTQLDVYADTSSMFSEEFLNIWDLALIKLKLLAEQELIFTHSLSATPEQVYKAWTEPNQLSKWFCPPGFEVTLCEVVPESGGYFRVHMKAPDGTISPTRGDYVELRPGRSIIYNDSWDDDRENNTPVLSMITFEPDPTGTKLSAYSAFESDAQRDEILSSGIKDGWMMFMDNLSQFLSTQG